MWEEPTDHPCEACGQQKDPTEVQIHGTEASEVKTTLDRVRGFIQGTDDESESSESKNNDTITETFYICSERTCDGREDDIRKMERWRLENHPNREFSEEKLDKIVSDRVETDKKHDQIISKNVEEVSSMLDQNDDEDNESDGDS